MSQKNRIVYAPAAIDDIDEIFSYISDDNVTAAEMMLDRLDKGIRNLEHFPNIGSVLSEDDFTLVRSGYRFIVISPYLVFYKITGDNVVIHRILHGHRDYLRGLFADI
jgi:toxin ParE1/3/4